MALVNAYTFIFHFSYFSSLCQVASITVIDFDHQDFPTKFRCANFKVIPLLHWRHRKIFSQGNLGKILKVCHFYLGFHLHENHDGIEYSHSILTELSDFCRVLSKFLKSNSQNSDETL